MHTRRGVLAVVGASVVAGCTSGSEQPTQQSNETIETNETSETEPEADDPDLSAGQIHDRWIELDKPLYVPAKEAGSKAFEAGREEGDLHTAFYRAFDAIADNFGHRSSTDLGHHKNIMRLLQAILPEGFQIYSSLEIGTSAKFNLLEYPVSRAWLARDATADDPIDVIASLDHEWRATHLKGTTSDEFTTAEQELVEYRDSENSLTHPPYDIKAIRNGIEYSREYHNATYTEQDLEEIYGSWLQIFDTLFWGEGMAVPVKGHWETYNEDFHRVHPEINRLYFNSELDGDIGAVSFEDGSVELYGTVEEYTPEQDGMPTESELTRPIS